MRRLTAHSISLTAKNHNLELGSPEALLLYSYIREALVPDVAASIIDIPTRLVEMMTWAHMCPP